jgi:hypothetical protein
MMFGRNHSTQIVVVPSGTAGTGSFMRKTLWKSSISYSMSALLC